MRPLHPQPRPACTDIRCRIKQNMQVYRCRYRYKRKIGKEIEIEIEVEIEIGIEIAIGTEKEIKM